MDDGDDDRGADELVSVLITADASEAEMIGEMLRREGVPTHVLRVNAALIGVPAHLFETRVEVPRRHLDRARELLSDVVFVGAAAIADGVPADAASPADAAAPAPQGEDGAAAGPATMTSRRRPILAAGMALVLPGGAHLYARRPWTTLVLVSGMLGCLVAAVIGADSRTLTSPIAGVALLLTVVSDMVGGVRAAAAESRGIRSSRSRQLLRGLLLFAVAVAVATAAVRVAVASRPRRGRSVVSFSVGCTDRSIVVRNLGDDQRVVVIDRVDVQITDSPWQPPRWRPAEVLRPSRLTLAPGATGSIGFAAEESVLAECRDEARVEPGGGTSGLVTLSPEAFSYELTGNLTPSPFGCRLLFTFALGETTLETSGVCAPVWGEAHQGSGSR